MTFARFWGVFRTSLWLLAMLLVFDTAPLSAQGAIDQDQAAAQAGQPQAQFALGLRYRHGDGVLQNFTTAVDWFAKAAQQGHAPAQNRLAQHLFEGLGISQDQNTALIWFEKAAQSGQAEFQYDYATALQAIAQSPQDLQRAVQMYQRAADQGHQDAMVSLAVMYQNGLGVEKDMQRALSLYEGPAEAGHARAQNNLGLLYVRGEGVQQDYARAAALFQKAVDQGLRVAMTNLGVMYENGFGVPLDEALAHELYRKGGRGEEAKTGPAFPLYDPRLLPPDTSPEGIKQISNGAIAGDPVSQFQMAWLLLGQSNPAFADQARAARLMQLAADQGLASAMTNLGWMYFEGIALPQDFVLGHMWLVLASSAGDRNAEQLNARLSAGMLADQINEAQSQAQKRRSLKIPIAKQ